MLPLLTNNIHTVYMQRILEAGFICENTLKERESEVADLKEQLRAATRSG